MNNKSKKILVGLIALMPVVLASCGKVLAIPPTTTPPMPDTRLT